MLTNEWMACMGVNFSLKKNQNKTKKTERCEKTEQ